MAADDRGVVLRPPLLWKEGLGMVDELHSLFVRDPLRQVQRDSEGRNPPASYRCWRCCILRLNCWRWWGIIFCNLFFIDCLRCCCLLRNCFLCSGGIFCQRFFSLLFLSGGKLLNHLRERRNCLRSSGVNLLKRLNFLRTCWRSCGVIRFQAFIRRFIFWRCWGDSCPKRFAPFFSRVCFSGGSCFHRSAKGFSTFCSSGFNWPQGTPDACAHPVIGRLICSRRNPPAIAENLFLLFIIIFLFANGNLFQFFWIDPLAIIRFPIP